MPRASSRNSPESNPARTEISRDLSEIGLLAGTESAMQVVEAARDLALKSVIRFGVSTQANKMGLLGALEVPAEIISLGRVRSSETSELWDRVSRGLSISGRDDLPLAEIRAFSGSELAAIEQGILDLSRTLPKDLRPLTPTLASMLEAINDRIPGGLRSWARDEENPGIREAIGSIERQRVIFSQLKDSESRDKWTGVTIQESNLIHAMFRHLETIPQEHKHGSSRQTPVLVSLWSESRNRYEPGFKSSRFNRSTLFDMSSHYFESVLDKMERHPGSRQLIRLLEGLRDLRHDFERSGVYQGNQERLHREQIRLYRSLFS